MGTVAIVYRYGSATDDALTPRAGKDTSVASGQQAGLSVWEIGPAAKQKAQKIDLAALATASLAYFPDDPAGGGQTGHGVIAPIDATGQVDLVALEEWASWRQSGRRHRFTEAILNAIVEKDVRSDS